MSQSSCPDVYALSILWGASQPIPQRFLGFVLAFHSLDHLPFKPTGDCR